MTPVPMETSPNSRRWRSGPILGALLLVVLALALAYRGIAAREHALTVVANETRELAVPTVAVMTPQAGDRQQEIVLPGTMQPFTDAPIYARVNGYLKAWHADIGTHVRAGELLAEIDTPELDQQLRQARADLATADANLKLAQTTAVRYRDLITTDSVSQQDVDNANGNLEARQAALESSRANVRRLEEMQGFRRIVAPFDGVITARNIDVGALIDSGSNAKELFHEAAIHQLRLFVNVPELYAPAARPGLEAGITLAEFPGRRFTGRLVRTANAIDVGSRTLLAEIDVANAKGELLPGAYAQVHFQLGIAAQTFKLPVNTLLFRTEGLRVATVDGHDRIVLAPITLGRDYGNEVEVVAGLQGGERVVVNPPDSLDAGQTVRIAAPDAPEHGAAR
jgi:RND family efflux transporter MFP subunit